jgi:hypothetical protein
MDGVGEGLVGIFCTLRLLSWEWRCWFKGFIGLYLRALGLYATKTVPRIPAIVENLSRETE